MKIFLREEYVTETNCFQQIFVAIYLEKLIKS